MVDAAMVAADVQRVWATIIWELVEGFFLYIILLYSEQNDRWLEQFTYLYCRKYVH